MLTVASQRGLAVSTVLDSQSLCPSGFTETTCLTHMGAQWFSLLARLPQVTPGLLLSRTQINFTVAIDFTASNGEWGGVGGGHLWAVVDNSAMSQVPHTPSSSCWDYS